MTPVAAPPFSRAKHALTWENGGMGKTTHSDIMRTPIADIAAHLIDHIGATLTATLAGVRDRKLPYKWAHGQANPRIEAFRRLQVAYMILRTLSESDSPAIARAWFIGMNPHLGDESPVMAIRNGDLNEVLMAAKAFQEDAYA